MPDLLFEDVQMLQRLRRQAAWTVVIAAVGFVGGLVLLSLFSRHRIADLLVACFLCLAWGGLTAWAALRLYRLQHQVWRLQLSDTRLVGYDYGRHARTLEWAHIHRLELADQELRLETLDSRRLVVPDEHAGFPELSHVLLDYAERFGCPLYLNGCPFEAIDLRTLLPIPPDISIPTDSLRQPSR